jgi:hypothetical protein
MNRLELEHLCVITFLFLLAGGLFYSFTQMEEETQNEIVQLIEMFN